MINPEQHVAEYKRWLADGGYPRIVKFDFVNENSMIWEIGYWLGDWVRKMVELYNPYFLVFEPMKDWYDVGVLEFRNNSKVKFFNFGLGSNTEIQKFGLDKDATGVFCPNRVHDVRIKSIVEFMKEQSVGEIELLQSNCEGGEYEIFSALITSGYIKFVKHIIIQFHNLRECHEEQRKIIQDGLSKTHTLELCYDWVFELWTRK